MSPDRIEHFHLDGPKRLTHDGPWTVFGWCLSTEAIVELAVQGAEGPCRLQLSERPDVRAAFPRASYITGFCGEVTRLPPQSSTLNFSVSFERDRQERTVPVMRPEPPTEEMARLARRVLGLSTRWPWLARSARDRFACALEEQWARLALVGKGAFDRTVIEEMLKRFAAAFPSASVVQVGANDGETGDPLRAWIPRTHWRCLLVEPMPHLFARLRRLYADEPRVVVANVALGDCEGTATLHHLREAEGLPIWYQQLASFDAAVLRKHAPMIPELEELLTQTQVPVTTPTRLLREHQFGEVDFLVTDTEGADWKILKEFPLDRIRPLLVMFEHQHLTADDRRALERTFVWAGYRVVLTSEGDGVAWRLPRHYRWAGRWLQERRADFS